MLMTKTETRVKTAQWYVWTCNSEGLCGANRNHATPEGAANELKEVIADCVDMLECEDRGSLVMEDDDTEGLFHVSDASGKVWLSAMTRLNYRDGGLSFA